MKQGLLWIGGAYTVCALILFVMLYWLTKKARSCDRKTCTYYVRYITHGRVELTHAEFHHLENCRTRVKDEVDALLAANKPVPSEKFKELRDLEKAVRTY